MNSSTPPSQVKTRLLILSDTHSTTPAAPNSSNPFRRPLPTDGVDVLLHCGDLTNSGYLQEHESTLSWITPHPAPLKIVIPGNHDITLDRPYYRQHGGVHGVGYRDGKKENSRGYGEQDLEEIRELYCGEEAKYAGIEYIEEGTREFVLGNGAKLRVYANCYTPEFCGWGFAYPRDQDRFGPEAQNPMPAFEEEGGVDVVITHGPPYGILDLTSRGDRAGCENLLKAVRIARPKVSCFGHIHEGWGAVMKTWDESKNEKRIDVNMDRVKQRMGAYVDAKGVKSRKETLFVNAAIMDVRNKPVQAPWLVDVMLDSNGK